MRRPRLAVVNVPALSGEAVTTQLIVENARAAGADVVCTEAGARDTASIAKALEANACDMLITIGGSGAGRTDATIAALAQRGEVLAHGIAMQPGRTSAAGRMGDVPVIALPGAPDQALAAWWTLALPVLDRLSGRLPRQKMSQPLKRKIASSVGIAEIALVENIEGRRMPLAVGELSLVSGGWPRRGAANVILRRSICSMKRPRPTTRRSSGSAFNWCRAGGGCRASCFAPATRVSRA